MFHVSDDVIQQNTLRFAEAYEKASKSGLLEEKFLAKTMPTFYKEVFPNGFVPYQVKFPKSNEAMLGGDFESSEVIDIKSPFEGPFGPMWFGNTKKGTKLICGYKNGDSRYPCRRELGDADIHGVLVGATGQGKSVTLNSIIYGACYMYAPWELSFVLCDAKIVEFKNIALNTPMPHIKAVAATEDADYLISVLEYYVAEMRARNSYFVKVGQALGVTVRKIEEFRNATGLALPQIIIVIDEFQVMFQRAGKKERFLNAAIMEFAKLGRNTGIHLLMASQEVGSDLPKNVMNNIKLRMAMGCQPAVSEAVLANDGASANMGKKGRMIINSETANKNSALYNELFIVPFARDECLAEMSKSIIALGDSCGYHNVMRFYDEDALTYEKDFPQFIRQYPIGPDVMYLGEPAFIMGGDIQCLALRFTNERIENIVIDTGDDSNLLRYLKTLRMNIEASGGINNVVLCTNPTITRDMKLPDFVGNLFYENAQYDGNDFFTNLVITVYKRKAMLEADKMIMSGKEVTSDKTDEWFDETFGRGSKVDTPLNRKRYALYVYLLLTDASLMMGLRLGNNANEAAAKEYAEEFIWTADDCNCNDHAITLDSFQLIYFWAIGAERVIGLGRSPRPNYVNELVRVMQDCCSFKVRVILTTSTIAEFTAIKNACKYWIIDGVTAQECNKIGCSDDFPDTVSKSLAVLYDSDIKNGRSCSKFKKLLHNGEII